jgi:hypothetical protein
MSAPSSKRSKSSSRAARTAFALVMVLTGATVSGVAQSQSRGGKPPAGRGKPSSAAVDAAMLPPPNFAGVPAGAVSVIPPKDPKNDLAVVVAVNPWDPATTRVLGAAPVAATSSSVGKVTTVGSAIPADQETALKALRAEYEAYRANAAGYSKTVNQIIRQRYEQKRKARLSSLQENIDKDQAELKKARLETMERLKAFIAKYPNAYEIGRDGKPTVEYTPDAMFRLAALFEEEAADNDLDPSDPQYADKVKALYQPAESLYDEIITRFPAYTKRPSVQFFLGALLSDTGRGPKSQWVWRALVCSNHYTYPQTEPASELERKAREKWKDGIPPMDQDHDQAFWDKWRETHYMPSDPKAKPKPGAKPSKKAPARLSSADAPEDTYTEVYPEDCEPLGGKLTAAGEEPIFLSQAWWRIGEYHYSRGDEVAEEEGYFGGDPFRYNRAYSAYQHAVKTTNETVRVFAMYKIAWTFFKQQRYDAAREQFLGLLKYFDEKEAKGGSAGDAQMRQDAYDYVASALTYDDRKGPAPEEPFIERDDIFGKYGGKELEAKLEPAVTDIQRPEIVPQDKPWTIKVYKSLASEFESDEVPGNAIKTYEIILRKWPCDPEAPQIQNKVAQLYDSLALKASAQSEKDDYARKALDARGKLSDYVSASTTTKWMECNKSNPDAIRAAEGLLNEGAKNAAGNYTARGRVAFSKAAGYPEGSKDFREWLEKALVEYTKAEQLWGAYLAADREAADSYETRFWIADAKHMQVKINSVLGNKLDEKQIDEAYKAAAEVRDSNQDDKYLRYAAYFAVDVYDLYANEQRDAFKAASCQPGAGRIEDPQDPTEEPGDSCRPDSEKDNRDPITQRRVWIRTVSEPIRKTLAARDEYIAHVPPNLDLDKNGYAFEYQVADALYRYGRFEEAVPRFEKLWRDRCGKDKSGWEAWYKLAVMAALKSDTKRVVALVDEEQAKKCAMDEDQKVKEKNFSEPAKIASLYKDAYEVFQSAEKETEPKAKAEKYRRAAALYELALKTAPGRPEAPEGAINSAYCYKQVNEYKRAVEVYRLFLDKYGKEDDLIAYRDGDAKKGIKRDPDQFNTRLKYTKQALGELGRTYLQSFDYQSAAKHYDEVASRTLLDSGERRDAAGNAVILQANLGNRDRMKDALKRYTAMGPPAADKAEIDFTVAEFEFKQWKQSPNDPVQKARATQALEGYYTAYKGQTPAAKFVVDAAYEVATIRKYANEIAFRDWYKKTVDAFTAYRIANKDALGTRESDYGAEAAYFPVDEEIARDWDTPVGGKPRLVYEGTADVVQKKLDEDAKKRDALATKLEDIIKGYASPKWVPVLYAREGSLFDTQRTALAKAKVQVLDPKSDALIKSIESKAQKVLDNPKATEEDQAQAQALMEKAAGIRDNVNAKWKERRAQYYATMEQPMIDRYARAYVRGKQFEVKDPWITKAVQRLAYYTDQLLDIKMAQYCKEVEASYPSFKYREQMFKQARPGSVNSQLPNVDAPTAAPQAVVSVGGGA